MRATGSMTTFERTPWPPRPAPTQFCPELGPDLRRGIQSRENKGPFSVIRAEPVGAAPIELLFGPFCLRPTQFLLLEGDKPVPVGSRALEILMVLLEHPGELVGKQELMARVWPNLFVEPANLTVHISALRRALRDGQGGNRFIINITGRGYSFVSPVMLSQRDN